VRPHLELVAALLCILLLTAAYVLGAGENPMPPGSLSGHGIGVLGFLLMLATETMYSWRKTRQRAQWGRMRTWLSVHVFTGIVGPYMVFLHTGFRFAGLAGFTFWMTLIVVGSGFIGRYLYTVIPHTATGSEMAASQLVEAIRQVEARLQAWLAAHPPQFTTLADQIRALPDTDGTGIAAFWRQPAVDRRHRQTLQHAVQGLEPQFRQQAFELRALLDQRHALRRQANTLTPARRLMAIWHALHVPLAVALFVSAVIHAAAAVYFRRG
jgi:hypothetical protein